MKELKLDDICSGNCYHICTNGLETNVIIRDRKDFTIAHNYLALSGWQTQIRIMAFTIMSNHVHVLVSCSGREQAEKFIRLFKRLYSTHLFNEYNMSNTLRGIKDSITLIDDISYFRSCVAYILRNALCARICKKVEDYPWSSYSCYFSETKQNSKKISDLGPRQRREILKTRQDLRQCPYLIGDDRKIDAKSFVCYEVVEKSFLNSGKYFLSCLGNCNDAKMEYEMTYKPHISINDVELTEIIEKIVQTKYYGKRISELTHSEKCSTIKQIYFNNKASIPQLSRILRLPKDLIRQILNQI